MTFALPIMSLANLIKLFHSDHLPLLSFQTFIVLTLQKITRMQLNGTKCKRCCQLNLPLSFSSVNLKIGTRTVGFNLRIIINKRHHALDLIVTNVPI